MAVHYMSVRDLDKIKARASTKEYIENWDRIFGKKNKSTYTPKDTPSKPNLKGKV